MISSIGQDADVVMFIHRKDVYTTLEEWEQTPPGQEYRSLSRPLDSACGDMLRSHYDGRNEFPGTPYHSCTGG